MAQLIQAAAVAAVMWLAWASSTRKCRSNLAWHSSSVWPGRDFRASPTPSSGEWGLILLRLLRTVPPAAPARREDPDDVGATLDLAVEALERVCRGQLGPVCGREGHVGEDVGFCLVHQGCELGDFGPELVGDAAPLRLGGLGIVLGEGGGDEGRDDAPSASSGMSERVAHEVHAAALPSGTEHLRDRRLDALVSFLRNAVPKVSASEGPMSMPSTSRRPSAFAFTPTSRKPGKYEPLRSFGMRSSTVPARVSQARSR